MTIKLAAASAALASATAVVLLGAGQPPASRSAPPEISQQVRSRVLRDGLAPAIVELALPGGAHVPEGLLRHASLVAAQRAAIRDTQRRVISKLSAGSSRVKHQFESVPYVAVELNAADLAALEQSPG